MTCDDTIHAFADVMASRAIRWRGTKADGVEYYYAEDRLYIIRDTRRLPFRYSIIRANDPATAVRWVIGEEEGDTE